MTGRLYLIDPKAPLVFRTGRPFGETGGADVLPFPLPSTLAGALRTAWAENQSGFDYQNHAVTLLEHRVAGPLLVQRDLKNGTLATLFPRPADVLYLMNDTTARPYRLAPGELPGSSGCDLPAGMCPVFLDEAAPKGKPAKDAPVFWSATTMNAWLNGELPTGDGKKHGVAALPVEDRTHVVIDPASYGVTPGLLFQSGGLDFGPRRQKDGSWEHHTYALLARFSAVIPPTLRRLGGEGRCVWIEPVNDDWPQMPEGLAARIAKSRRLRLLLATPALFADGWRPGWLDADTLEGCPPGLESLRLKLVACALDRWQPLSGWDLAKQKPRAVRRLTNAGAVYWFELLAGDEEALAQLWLTPVSDGEQDRRDGFGLALPGIWKH